MVSERIQRISDRSMPASSTVGNVFSDTYSARDVSVTMTPVLDSTSAPAQSFQNRGNHDTRGFQGKESVPDPLPPRGTGKEHRYPIELAHGAPTMLRTLRLYTMPDGLNPSTPSLSHRLLSFFLDAP